jgi:hypothetical protein
MRVDVFSVSNRSCLQKYLRRNSRTSLGLLSFILIFSIAFFCWQWSAPASPGKNGTAPFDGNYILGSSSGLSRANSWFTAFLKDSRLAPLRGIILPDSDNAFRNMSNREMISADGDPFLYAYLSGESEGVLVVKEVTGGIITLGLPGITGAASRSPSANALQFLQSEVGGSFSAFHSKLFGESSNGSMGTGQEENPFSKALSAATESEDAASESLDDSEANSEDGQETTTGESDSGVASGLTNRPYLMLRVDESGNLQAMAASQPYEGAFETAELGTMDYSLLSFGDTPDFMGNIAVADFNGDGIADVAYFTPFQGLLRFFYGFADGTFAERMNIELGNTPGSIATGDFNNDGQVDIAFSSNGGGLVRVFFREGPFKYDYKAYYFENYWDYTVAADTTGSGNLDLVGVNYSDNAVVLLNFDQASGSNAGSVFNYTPALDSSISTSKGQSVDLRAVLLSSALSLSADNSLSQMKNVLNVAAGTKISIVVGELYGDGRTIFGIAIPHP